MTRAAPRPIRVLHEDARLLVVDKPPGLLTVPAPRGETRPTLVERLRAEGRVVLPVHRLDQETSGVVVLARDPEARAQLMALFKERRVRKIYVALVQGHPRPPDGTIRFSIKDLGATAMVSPRGAPAETVYRTLERLGPCALVEAEPKTGRHNQIRLHFAHLGMPLVGERKYARGRDAVVRMRRVALHALRISFVPPWGGEELVVEAPLPADLAEVVASLRAS